jgi:hypothetical protein
METTYLPNDYDDLDGCPACGSIIDYCQGHGEIGDPDGFAILALHDSGDHSECSADAWCEPPASSLVAIDERAARWDAERPASSL